MNRSNLTLTVVASSTPLNSLPVTNILDMNPIQHYIAATVSFMDQLNWTRIGLITDDTYYHLFAAEMLQKKLLENPKRSIAPYIRIVGTQEDLNLQEFSEYGTQIIISLAKKELECLILSKITKINFTWPNYASVFLNLNSDRYDVKLKVC